MVHGLDIHSAVQLTDTTIAKIKQASVLAPLHNPPGLQGIEAAMKVFGGVPQVRIARAVLICCAHSAPAFCAPAGASDNLLPFGSGTSTGLHRRLSQLSAFRHACCRLLLLQGCKLVCLTPPSTRPCPTQPLCVTCTTTPPSPVLCCCCVGWCV